MVRPASNVCYMVFGLVLLAGCSGKDSPTLRVTGTVKYADGEAVQGEMANIVFQPDQAAGQVPAKSATGVIEPDGSFELMTQSPGDGAYPGGYKVVLQVWENYREQTPGVPSQYTSAATTPLQATVSADSRTFDFVVER